MEHRSFCEQLLLLTIDDWAFHGCTGITRIDLSHTRVTALEKHAFANCTSLAEIIFPDTLVHMGEYCFYSCAAITAPTWPRPKSPLWQKACFNAARAYQPSRCLPHSLPLVPAASSPAVRWRGSNGLTTIAEGAFAQCSALTDLRTPASVAIRIAASIDLATCFVSLGLFLAALSHARVCRRHRHVCTARLLASHCPGQYRVQHHHQAAHLPQRVARYSRNPATLTSGT